MFKKSLLVAMLLSFGAQAQEAQINEGEIKARSIIAAGTVIIDTVGINVDASAISNNLSVTVNDMQDAPSLPIIVQINRGEVTAYSTVVTPVISNVEDLSVTSTAVGNNVSIDGARLIEVDQENVAPVLATSSLVTDNFVSSENLVTVGSTAVGNNLNGDLLTLQPSVIQNNSGDVTALSRVNVSQALRDVQGLDVISAAIANNASLSDINQLQTTQVNNAPVTATSSIRVDTLRNAGQINVNSTSVGNNLNIVVNGNGQ